MIELNRAIRETVDEDLRAYSGAPYSLPGVDAEERRRALAARRARHALRRHPHRLHDTLSAASAQGFALSEANLYTSRRSASTSTTSSPAASWPSPGLHRLVGDEALRTTVLALEALKRDGVAEPERGVPCCSGATSSASSFGTVLARREPWTPRSSRRSSASRRAREGVAFAPGGPVPARVGASSLGREPAAFCEGYRLDVCPPTDDRPFFFNMKRARRRVQRAAARATSTPSTRCSCCARARASWLALCALAFGLPLALVRERPPLYGSMTFFAAIGVGFLLFEATSSRPRGA